MKSERERIDGLVAGLVADIRDLREPSPDVCRELLSLDHLDSVRNAASVDDLDAIIRLLLVAVTPDIFRIAIHLLQGLNTNTRDKETKARVRGILEGAWLSARNDPEKGWSISAALLDNRDLPLFFHNALLDFYLRTWDQGREYMVRLCGGADRIVEWTGKRLLDPRFPTSKHWAYILVLGYSSDREGVTQLIARLGPTDDPLVRRAAAEVQNRLSLEQRTLGVGSAGRPANAPAET